MEGRTQFWETVWPSSLPPRFHPLAHLIATVSRRVEVSSEPIGSRSAELTRSRSLAQRGSQMPLPPMSHPRGSQIPLPPTACVPKSVDASTASCFPEDFNASASFVPKGVNTSVTVFQKGSTPLLPVPLRALLAC